MVWNEKAKKGIEGGKNNMASMQVCTNVFGYSGCDAYPVDCDGNRDGICDLYEKPAGANFGIYFLYRLGSCSPTGSGNFNLSRYVNGNWSFWVAYPKDSYVGYCYLELIGTWAAGRYKMEFQGASAEFKICPTVPTSLVLYNGHTAKIGQKIELHGSLMNNFGFDCGNQPLAIKYSDDGGATFKLLRNISTDVTGNFWTEYTVSLPVGNYILKAEFASRKITNPDGYWYTLIGTESTTLNITVVQPQGTLNVSTASEPPGSVIAGDIYVNGVLKGNTTISIPLTPGSYWVTFGNVAGYTKPSPKSALIVDGQITTITGTYTKGEPEPTPNIALLLIPAAVAGAAAWYLKRKKKK